MVYSRFAWFCLVANHIFHPKIGCDDLRPAATHHISPPNNEIPSGCLNLPGTKEAKHVSVLQVCGATCQRWYDMGYDMIFIYHVICDMILYDPGHVKIDDWCNVILKLARLWPSWTVGSLAHSGRGHNLLSLTFLYFIYIENMYHASMSYHQQGLSKESKLSKVVPTTRNRWATDASRPAENQPWSHFESPCVQRLAGVLR